MSLSLVAGYSTLEYALVAYERLALAIEHRGNLRRIKGVTCYFWSSTTSTRRLSDQELATIASLLRERFAKQLSRSGKVIAGVTQNPETGELCATLV